MCIEYQQFAEQQERQEYFDKCVKAAVEMEVQRIIESATCFECDNPLEVLETEDGGISVRGCLKCGTVETRPLPEVLADMDVIIGRMNQLTRQINGRG